MTQNKGIGTWGEQAACRFLVSRGYRILHRNWRAGRGEIDIICADPKGATVFVEVKARTSLIFGEPEEAITLAKQRMLRATVSAYLSANKAKTFRVDVITLLTHDGITTLKHLKNIELAI